MMAFVCRRRLFTVLTSKQGDATVASQWGTMCYLYLVVAKNSAILTQIPCLCEIVANTRPRWGRPKSRESRAMRTIHVGPIRVLLLLRSQRTTRRKLELGVAARCNDSHSQKYRSPYRHDGHGGVACQEDGPGHTTRVSERVEVCKPDVTHTAGFFLADSVPTPQRMNAVINTCEVARRAMMSRPQTRYRIRMRRAQQALLRVVLACVDVTYYGRA